MKLEKNLQYAVYALALIFGVLTSQYLTCTVMYVHVHLNKFCTVLCDPFYAFMNTYNTIINYFDIRVNQSQS